MISSVFDFVDMCVNVFKMLRNWKQSKNVLTNVFTKYLFQCWKIIEHKQELYLAEYIQEVTCKLFDPIDDLYGFFSWRWKNKHKLIVTFTKQSFQRTSIDSLRLLILLKRIDETKAIAQIKLSKFKNQESQKKE